jgi:hypothetical protein
MEQVLRWLELPAFALWGAHVSWAEVLDRAGAHGVSNAHWPARRGAATLLS